MSVRCSVLTLPLVQKRNWRLQRVDGEGRIESTASARKVISSLAPTNACDPKSKSKREHWSFEAHPVNSPKVRLVGARPSASISTPRRNMPGEAGRAITAEESKLLTILLEQDKSFGRASNRLRMMMQAQPQRTSFSLAPADVQVLPVSSNVLPQLACTNSDLVCKFQSRPQLSANVGQNLRSCGSWF